MKKPVELTWFKKLREDQFHQPQKWMSDLGTSVDSFVSFGCMTKEPFFLLWGLDAVEAKVIEKKKEHIQKRREDERDLKKMVPDAFKGRSIEFVSADMSCLTDNDVPTSHFDLAFCKKVLYIIFLDELPMVQDSPRCKVNLEIISQKDCENALTKLQCAINQMARVVKGGGYVVAFERIALTLGGEAIDISELFEKAGLQRETQTLSTDPDEDVYCYVKPLG